MFYGRVLDVIVGHASATLGFKRRLNREFEDPSIKPRESRFCSRFCPKFEYSSWDSIYGVQSAEIEHVQEKSIKYAIRSLGWYDSRIVVQDGFNFFV
jgi:hypothetical protein